MDNQIYKTISSDMSQDFVMITCTKCEYNFILFGLLIGEDEYDYIIKHRVFPQVRTNYCPNCGYKNTDK